jgi:hypothetical protein
MSGHKFRGSISTLFIVVAAPSATPLFAVDAPGPPLPNLNGPHREFLARLARRTVRDAVSNRKPYEPEYVPSGMEGVAAEAVVRLRQHGFLLGAGAGGPAPIAQATRDAALAAAARLKVDQRTAADLVDQLLLEVEIVGTAEPVPVPGDWRTPGAADEFIEPGIHGLALAIPGGMRRVCPSEILAGDLSLVDALKLLAQGDASQEGIPALLRFRTLHWYQPAAAANTVELHRGMTLVPPRGGLTRRTRCRDRAACRVHRLSPVAVRPVHLSIRSGTGSVW